MLQLQCCKITFICLLKKSICSYEPENDMLWTVDNNVYTDQNLGESCRYISIIKCDTRLAKNIKQFNYISLHSIKKIQNFALIVTPWYDLDKTLNFNQYSCCKKFKVADKPFWYLKIFLHFLTNAGSSIFASLFHKLVVMWLYVLSKFLCHISVVMEILSVGSLFTIGKIL